MALAEVYSLGNGPKKYCKRDMVEKIHSDGRSDCLFCFRQLNGLLSICNHLSRRMDCREYYIDELVPFQDDPEKIAAICAAHSEQSKMYPPAIGDDCLNSDSRADSVNEDNQDEPKSPSQLSTSSQANEGHQSNDSAGIDSYSNATENGFRKSSQVLPVRRNRKRIFSLPSPIDNNDDEDNIAETEEIIIAPEEELISKAYLIRHPVQCAKCNKIFRGKTPAVAYNNHRRNRHCPMSSSKKMTLKQGRPPKSSKGQKLVFKKEIIRSNPDQEYVCRGRKPSNITDILLKRGKMSDLLRERKKNVESNNNNKLSSGVQYYCKLCPTEKVTSRVSLTIHLMAEHGLPSVYVNTGDETVLNCQSCSQTFYSKYTYNLHRFNCDLRSPYIGIVKESLPKVIKTLKSLIVSNSMPIKHGRPEVRKGNFGPLEADEESEMEDGDQDLRQDTEYQEKKSFFRCNWCRLPNFKSRSDLQLHIKQCLKNYNRARKTWRAQSLLKPKEKKFIPLEDLKTVTNESHKSIEDDEMQNYDELSQSSQGSSVPSSKANIENELEKEDSCSSDQDNKTSDGSADEMKKEKVFLEASIKGNSNNNNNMFDNSSNAQQLESTQLKTIKLQNGT